MTNVLARGHQPELITGMKFLHGARFSTGDSGAVHGNLTPQNILTESGNIKISDIGLARAFRGSAEMLSSDLLPERLPYVAPEQLEDPAREDKLTDIYSFGAVMYEVATGTPPKAAKKSMESPHDVVGPDPAPPRMRNRACPRWLEETILKCMAREPDNRFQSFEHVETLVNEILKIEGVPEVSGESGERSTRTSRVARIRGMAKKQSSRLDQYYLGVEHLMLGLLDEEESLVLGSFGDKVTIEALRSEITSQMPKGEGPWRWEGMKKTPRYRRVLKLARQIKNTYADERMLSQHLLLAILKEGQSLPIRALRNLKVNLEDAAKKLQKELGRRRPSILVTACDTAMAHFANKVSFTTESPYFTPFIGRQSEMERAQDILTTSKNGITVVGEPGVGKTAFIQQLACILHETAADTGFKHGSIFKLRIPAILASADEEQEILENFTKTMNEIMNSDSIVLIEDIALLLCLCLKMPPQAADVLKEYISSQGLLMIATATPAGYSLCESEHKNLMRYLEVINLHEPSEEETLEMLKGAKDIFEVEHSVRILDDALGAVLNFSAEFENNRALPARAFELLDRTCVTSRLKSDAYEKPDFSVIITAEHVKHTAKGASQTVSARKNTKPEA